MGKKTAKKTRAKKSNSAPPSTSIGNIKFSTDRLTQLLSESGKQFAGIEKELEKLKGNYIVMVLGSVDHYEFIPTQVLKYVSDKKMNGIFITVNKPYEEIANELGGKTDHFYFIDAVTQMVGRNTISAKNVTYLESPTNLLEVILEVEKQLKEQGNQPSFLIIDSISTLMIYNSPKLVKKFCHTIIGKIRQMNVRGVLLAIDSEENKGDIQTVAQFVDHVIQM